MCSALICCRPAPYQSFDSSRLKHSLKNTYTCYTRNNSPWKNPQKRLSRLADPHPAFGSLLASFSSSSQSGCRRSTSGSALLLFPDIKYEHDVTSHKSTGTQNPPKVLLSNPPKKTTRKTNGHYVRTSLHFYLFDSPNGSNPNVPSEKIHALCF